MLKIEVKNAIFNLHFCSLLAGSQQFCPPWRAPRNLNAGLARLALRDALCSSENWS